MTNTTVEGVRPTRNAMPAATLATSLVIVISDGISLPQKSHTQNNNKGYSFPSVIVYSLLCLFMCFGSHPRKYPWTLCQLTDSSWVDLLTGNRTFSCLHSSGGMSRSSPSQDLVHTYSPFSPFLRTQRFPDGNWSVTLTLWMLNHNFSSIKYVLLNGPWEREDLCTHPPNRRLIQWSAAS